MQIFGFYLCLLVILKNKMFKNIPNPTINCSYTMKKIYQTFYRGITKTLLWHLSIKNHKRVLLQKLMLSMKAIVYQVSKGISLHTNVSFFAFTYEMHVLVDKILLSTV